ncbi:DegT/DnrJ/EryC1/StrS family aminotransferase [Rudaeicoccus suwonensis]|uniref:dTDP-4-amino-4,6-dideoxygalactose transaminase n=1 Tax=Rudaeicoccus suwonensis TaxID=657409 RepID=A0A561EBW1_9MICO|nr:DegT/DnrJ/EryC1/StrS family aminotransferase [Rudaeicoccus suwonensis]TWE13097.1 dTDP-4-amino-4,6-dideoxygalactose transaminase [Rudaeicoccus suwonensis]
MATSSRPQLTDAHRHLATITDTDPSDWHLVFRARYAMALAFGAMADLHGPGDVATQLLTCATAVDPIMVGGLRPEYAEVSPASLALDPEALELTDATRAVVLQHTFGIIDDARSIALREKANRAGVILVEDSAHCVGRMARDADGMPLADLSIHSFGAEKILPTRFGGAIWVNPRLSDRALHHRLTTDLTELPAVSTAVSLRSRAYRNQVRVLNRLPGAVSAQARSAMTALRLFEPLIGPAERRGGLERTPMQPAPWMTAQAAHHLGRITEIERGRAAATAEYLRALAGHVQMPDTIDAAAPLVRFPFFVDSTETAERLIRELTAGGVYAGRWYRPALFPGPDDPAAYNLDPASTTPQTQDLIARIVNLPTTLDVAGARRAADLLLSLRS